MFIPKRILFEKGSLDYEIGKNIYNTFKDNKNIEIIKLTSNKIKERIPGENLHSFYREGKNTLVVGIKKRSKFQSCKPSANDILNEANEYIKERLPSKTLFEGSATSDPIPIEPYTNSLKKAIEFFANSDHGLFRFVTKFNDVDSLLDIDHKGHTEIRFTLNTDKVISDFENRAASIDKRIEASVKVANAGYPIGFIIAPVFLYEGWKNDYKQLLLNLKDKLPDNLTTPVTFEIISHRYTPRAKNIILEVFPETTLPMVDEERKYKYGQFGYGKYVYTKEQLEEMKEFFSLEIDSIFNNKVIKYII